MSTTVHGFAKEPFAGVERWFAEGFDAGRDVGASVAAVRGGEVVVDLWAGYKDRARSDPWQRDTLVCCFSVSKALTTVCTLQAIDAGLIEIDATVGEYWPEFAVNGKEAITVRHLLTHQAGLVGFHELMEKSIYYDWDRCCAALAAEKPWWEPGTKHGYHARTFGFLLGEVLRRAADYTVGEWLRARIVDPLNVDVHIGLDPAEQSRCATMLPARITPGEEKTYPDGIRRMMEAFNDPTTPTGAAFNNPNPGPGYMNSEEFRAAEIPAVNGHATARGLATLFAQIPKLVSADLLQEATHTQSRGLDECLRSVSHFGLGFMLYDTEAPIGEEGSYGHAGAGGSVAFCDPGNDLAFAFVMNQMQEGVVTGGTSATACADAVYRSIL